MKVDIKRNKSDAMESAIIDLSMDDYFVLTRALKLYKIRMEKNRANELAIEEYNKVQSTLNDLKIIENEILSY